MAGGCVDLSMQYNKSMATFMGEDMAMEVGGAELAVTEVMKPDNKDRFKIAHEREISQMAERRFVRPGDAVAMQGQNMNHLCLWTSSLTSRRKEQ